MCCVPSRSSTQQDTLSLILWVRHVDLCCAVLHPFLQPVLSMRTIYKVHLNFPGLNTLESKALEARRAVINRCRTELSGQPPLELLRDERLLQEQWQEAQVRGWGHSGWVVLNLRLVHTYACMRACGCARVTCTMLQSSVHVFPCSSNV